MDRVRILMCGHPNPLGCPNHGDIAREVWQGAHLELDPDVEVTYVLGEIEDEPIPYSLTDKGWWYLRSEGVPPVIWPF